MPARITNIGIIFIIIMTIAGCSNSDNNSFKWTVRGRVVGPDAQPIADVSVFATNNDGYQTWSYGSPKVIPWKLLTERYPTPNYYFFGPFKPDKQGNFAIKLKGPVRGLVMLRHPDYLQVERTIDPNQLTPDNTIDVGIIALDSGASVTGGVTGPEGKPARNVDVGLCRRGLFYDDYIRLVKTDKQGRYIFKGLPDSKYAMAAWDKNSVPCEKEIEIKKDTSSAVLDFTLSEKGRRVKVLVKNRYTDQPVPFCHVQITLLTDQWPNPVIDTKITGIDGTTEFIGIPNGKCLIEAVPPDQMRLIRSIHPRPPFSPFYRFFGDEKTVTLKIDPPITLKGRIIDANTSQPVREFRITAIPDRKIFDKVYDETYGSPWEINTDTTTSSSGSFIIDGFRAGRWRLQIRADGYVAEKEGFLVDIPVGGLKDKLEIPLKPGTGKISGIVLDAETGKPLSGIKVRAYEWDPGLFGVNNLYTLTDDNGNFSFHNLISEEFSLTIWAEKEGYVKSQIRFEPDKDKRPSVLEPILLEYTCTLKGRYIDANGKPVPGAKIILSEKGQLGKVNDLQTTTKTDGSFEITNIPKGEYFIHYHDKKEPVVFTKPGAIVSVILK